MLKRYEIVRHYNVCGQSVECLCYDAGCAIILGEDRAKAQVAKLHAMGYADARYIELPMGEAWFDDENYIG